MSAARKLASADPVAEAARKALKTAKGDVQVAVAALEGNVRRNAVLREALTDPLIHEACYDAVRQQIRKTRHAVWTPPNVATGSRASKQAIAEQSARVIHLATGTMLMFPLPGGKPLKDATRAEIMAASGFYERQGKDMAEKATWLRLVAQCITGKKTAGAVLTDKRLRELQVEARKHAN